MDCVSRSLLDACQHALDLNESLISTDQLLYHKDMKSKFQKMLATLSPLIDSDSDDRVSPIFPSPPLSLSSLLPTAYTW